MRRRPLALVVSVALLGLPVAALAPSGSAAPPTPDGVPAAVPGGPASVFDQTSVGWLSYRNQSSAQFHDTYLERRSTYLPLDLDIDTEDDYEVGSVWQSNSDARSWRVKRNLTSAKYKAYWEKQKEAGFRPTEIETYRDGGRKWAGLWVENVEGYGWASYRGRTASELEDIIDAQTAKGRMPIDFDEYLVDGKRRYNIVWVTSTVRDWELVRDRSEAQWKDDFEELSDDDYRVLSFESLEIDDKQKYGAIWVTNDNGRRWAARRDMSSKGYSNWWYRYRDLGYRLVGFNRYETDDGTRYSGIWRQNNARPDWSLKDEVDALVEDWRDADGIPGIGVAVYVDEVPVYLRGFGLADEDGTWLDSAHVNSIASVAKAVAGVLTFRLMEQDPDLDLTDTTRSWVPTMPNHQTHTVGQLLSNRGCVGHYDELGSFSGDYDTALEASEEFWDEQLVCDPLTDDEDNYSTHGYTFLGAALEAAEGDDIKSLVRDELVVPFGTGTLRTQRETGHRMSQYDTDDDEISPSNNDWKVLGGGLESSTADLARFGAMLANGEILSRTSFNTMWTPPTPASGYAFGWSTGTLGSQQVVAKNGSQSGVRSYLRLYPGADISVAVITNSKAQNPDGLGRDIGDLVATAPTG